LGEVGDPCQALGEVIVFGLDLAGGGGVECRLRSLFVGFQLLDPRFHDLDINAGLDSSDLSGKITIGIGDPLAQSADEQLA